MQVEEWGVERAEDLAALARDALPDEHLTLDELLSCCWDAGGTVLGLSDGAGAVAAVAQPAGEHPVAFVQLLAVHPGARGEGRGRRLLEAAHEWAFEGAGATAVRVAGAAPFYLWPGVDVRFTRALCLVEAAGYRPDGAELNMSYPSSFRAPPPDGVVVRRVLEDADRDAVLALCAEHWPHWVAETRRGIEHGACHGAFVEASPDGGEAGGASVAFVCHSVNRGGWLGPMATDPGRRRSGIGRALLSAVAADLRPAGYADVEVAWVGPVGFYARAAGAAVSRVFRTATLRRP